jgi:hypothetical protein
MKERRIAQRRPVLMMGVISLAKGNLASDAKSGKMA